MTRTVVARGYGGPENLALIDEPDRDPGADEVVVRVAAIGVNPIDHKLYSGAFGSDPDGLPVRLGNEAAGTVVEVADGVSGPTGPIAVGDEVVVYPVDGAYTDRIVAPSGSILHIPTGVSVEQAAGLLAVGVTAYDLIRTAGVTGDDTVVVHGGTGAVGSLAVQIAVAAGARVIATGRLDNHAAIEALGATAVAYGDGLLDRLRAASPDGYTVALDAAGTDEAIDASLELVAERSRIVSIVAFGRAGDGIVVIDGSSEGSRRIRSETRTTLLDQLAAGDITVTTAKTFPLADAADAHRELQSSHPRGKFLLIP
ncbi:NADP-dependent oxidoreductase [Williamsia herbipolensis]|uniref:NADP-dependent oxidoreductase n=1 Tax=Williamsia herbipolensis TaxID=1603258 RepID=A0AAU4JZB5_9NOCA|nr:NADP-dependent oxidoreductase [Williamsia herbipolensis]